MVFARTPVLRLAAKKVERADVSLSMRKWWSGGFKRQEGLVSDDEGESFFVGWCHAKKGNISLHGDPNVIAPAKNH
jgi:hypothetical protein